MKKILGIFGVIAMVACAPAHAGSSIVWGKVVDVKPVYTQIHQNIPKDVCRQVQVPVYGNNGQTNNGNAILGAIIGGVVGNQFGKGESRHCIRCRYWCCQRIANW
mgnify:CR=1 FL=1